MPKKMKVRKPGKEKGVDNLTGKKIKGGGIAPASEGHVVVRPAPASLLEPSATRLIIQGFREALGFQEQA